MEAGRGWASGLLMHVAVCVSLIAVPISAQTEASGTQVANGFLTSFQRLDWNGVAARTDRSVLETFREHVTSMASHDATNRVTERILHGSAASRLDALDDRALFAQLLEALHTEVPMLVGVLATNRYQTLGAISEADTLVHVLVRTTPYTTGSTSSAVEVVTLRATSDGWLVVDAAALDALLVALGTFGRE